jgi:hypothetical protein
MSFELIGLGKLLRAMYADRSDRTRLLREDIRNTLRRERGDPQGDGGDFYVPFWADAKRHVRGLSDLRESTEQRIESNRGRRRLYELLEAGFLSWWEERRRLRNEPFTIGAEVVRARFNCEGLGVVKVENTLSITVGDDGHRIVYPYFPERPVLSEEAARLGLWIMSQALVPQDVEGMRMLDVIRGRTFSVLDTPLTGDEERIFRERYERLLQDWQRLRADYE